jgi:hypothetical protein
MTHISAITTIERLKRENARLRRHLAQFANEDYWVYANNSDLLRAEVFAFVPSSDKIQEAPWKYAKRGLLFKAKSRSQSEKPSSSRRFKELL